MRGDTSGSLRGEVACGGGVVEIRGLVGAGFALTGEGSSLFAHAVSASRAVMRIAGLVEIRI